MKRIIGVIGLYHSGAVIQTVSFQPNTIVHASSVHAVHKFYNSGIDEIVIIDLTKEGLEDDFVLTTVCSILKKCFIPVIYAGHLRSKEQIDKLFLLGVDRVLACSDLLNGSTNLASYVIDKFGSQAFVAGVDIPYFSLDAICCARFLDKKLITKNLHAYLKRLSDLGVSEVFLNSPSADGNRNGYALVPDQSDKLVMYADQLKYPLWLWAVLGMYITSLMRHKLFCGVSSSQLFSLPRGFSATNKKSLKKMVLMLF